MDHLIQPLEQLQERAGQFLTDRKARVLHVPTDEELTSPAREVLQTLQWHPDNRRAFFELSVPFSTKAPGWTERAGALREAYIRQVAAFDHQAIGLPALPPPDPRHAPLQAFVTTLAAINRVFAASGLETEGVLLLVDPGHTPEGAAFAQHLGELAAFPALDQVRWVWLEPLWPGDAVAPEITLRLGAEAWQVPCSVDRHAQKKETDELVAGMLAAAASGGVPGVARPRVMPPPHPGDPPRPAQPLPPAVPPGFIVGLLEGLQALRAGKSEDALAPLRRARDACLAAGDLVGGVDMDVLLATIAAEVAARRGTPREPILTSLEGAARRAEEAALFPQASKTSLILGCLARLAKDGERAGRAFMRAASQAAQARIPLMQFHALRMAGEVALEANLRGRAQTLWREALDTAASVPRVEADAGGLTASAEELTAAFDQQGFSRARGQPKPAEAVS
jgi:hypothetical protein